MAIASLILGILGFLASMVPFVGIFFGLVAIILGLLGRRRLLEEGRSSGMAVGGLVFGVLALVIGTVSTVACFTCARSCSLVNQPVTEADDRAGQQAAEEQLPNLQQMLNQENQDNQQNPTPIVPTTPGVPPTPGVPTPATPTEPVAPPPAGGQLLSIGAPVNALFTPGLPAEPDSGRPYMDYTFNVPAAGNYTFNLVSLSAQAYDPYLRLLQNGTEVAHDDDGGGYPNSRINQMLAPGTYTVRVTSFSRSQITAPASFTLSVTGG